MHSSLLSAALASSLVVAQDAPPVAPQPNPAKELARQAFACFDAASTWDCEVVIEAPESGGELAGMMIMAGGGGGGDDAKDFQGSAEFIVTEDREHLLVSIEKLPGFACFDNGDRRLVESLKEDTGVNATSAISDIYGLLDSSDLAKHMEKSEFTEAVDPTTGTRTLNGTLSKRMLRSSDSGSPMAMFAPKVLMIDATLAIDAQGAVMSAEFRVLRTDPQAGLRKQLQESAGGEGGMVMSGMPTASDDPGATHVYKLTRKSSPPTERAQKFYAAMREIVDEV